MHSIADGAAAVDAGSVDISDAAGAVTSAVGDASQAAADAAVATNDSGGGGILEGLAIAFTNFLKVRCPPSTAASRAVGEGGVVSSAAVVRVRHTGGFCWSEGAAVDEGLRKLPGDLRAIFLGELRRLKLMFALMLKGADVCIKLR